MPTLTRQNNIDVQALFSQSKSAALQNMLQYTFLNQLTKVIQSFLNLSSTQISVLHNQYAWQQDYTGTQASCCIVKGVREPDVQIIEVTEGDCDKPVRQSVRIP